MSRKILQILQPVDRDFSLPPDSVVVLPCPPPASNFWHSQHPAQYTILHLSAPNTPGLLPTIAMLLVAIFLFDLQAVLIKIMGRSYPVEQVVLMRNLFGLLPNLLVLWWTTSWQHAGRPWKIPQWRLGFGRGAMLITAQVSFYLSLQKLDLAVAATIGYISPIIITLLSIPVLGARIGWIRSAAVACGFCGVLMVMQPGDTDLSVYIFLPLIAAFFYALASVTSRLFDSAIPTPLINLYSAAGSASCSFLVVLFIGDYHTVESMEHWLMFLLMGLVGGVAVLLMITAYRRTDPGNLSPFEYFGIPISFILGWMFFNEAPFHQLIPGAFFIVAGGLLVLWRQRLVDPRHQVDLQPGKADRTDRTNDPR